jgi:riboflavin synthase
MFTGLVQDRGRVEAVQDTGDGVRLRVVSRLAGELDEGDSVAVDGVCLTATAVHRNGFAADVVAETLRRSTLAGLVAGAPVNLELPLRPFDRLGGHVVQGHVDGVGTVLEAG